MFFLYYLRYFEIMVKEGQQDIENNEQDIKVGSEKYDIYSIM